jgi:hypothetical protein
MAVMAVALAVGFLIGTWRSGVHIETGEAHSTGNGGGTITTDRGAYGFPADIAWLDADNTWHEGGVPDCLPPLSFVDGVRFGWVEVAIEGTGWRPVVWIDCRSVVRSPTPTTASPVPSQAAAATSNPISSQPAATLVFRTAVPPSPPPPSALVGCAGGALGPFTLHGIRSGSDVLVWLEQDDQRKLAAVWPNGFTAEFNPDLELRDAEGTVVAREGDNIEGGGSTDEHYSNLLYVWSFNGLSYPCVSYFDRH